MKRIIPVIGGLGNQLFITAYGLYRHFIHHEQVELVKRPARRGNNTHGHDLHREVKLPSSVSWRDEQPAENFCSRLQREASMWGLARVVEAAFSVVHFREGEPLSASVGQSHDLLGHAVSIRDEGYFQKPDYLEAIQHKGLLTSVQPLAPSAWFKEMTSSVMGHETVGVHVRRGDFLTEAGPGALSAQYYASILADKRIRKNAKVLVFSDSIDQVPIEFSNYDLGVDVEFVRPPKGASPVESLALLSMFSTLVISNSTFSWWAAKTGNLQKSVISPKAWAETGSPAHDVLNDPNWELRESSWIPSRF